MENSIKRRQFIKQSALLSAGALAFPAYAHGMSGSDVKSNRLYDSGKPTTYLKSKNELDFIGMPAGGIGCGMVYLGGDGRLWLWDIFNKNQSGVVYKNIPWHEKIQNNFQFLRPFDGANYVDPVKDVRPLFQEFAVRVETEGKNEIRKLQASDWGEISFEATYPMATVRYIDPRFPVAITLKAGSPFIPLNETDSGLPATMFSFTIENKSAKPISVSLEGILENKTSINSANDHQFTRSNKAIVNGDFSAVMFSASSFNWADESFENAPDHGDYCLLSFNPDTRVNTDAGREFTPELFNAYKIAASRSEFDSPSYGAVGNTIMIAPGGKSELHYAITWYFPNLLTPKIGESKRYYSVAFPSSAAIGQYLATNFAFLRSETNLWCDTWQDSTLPHWFLERTLLNVSTLATTTCHRFSSGRFYAWEGVGSCPGTCNHVWQYAHAVARLFPALERDTRERVDLGAAFHDDGHIGFRGEYDMQPSIDGQAGRVLGIWREHQMSADSAFLKRNWPKTKQAIEFILVQDTNGDGMVDTQLENTLDAKWPGEIAWIVGLCLAAVKAGEMMAAVAQDDAFGTTCRDFVARGKASMETSLFNGEYFIHRPDPLKGKTVLGSYNTCHIDQVYGQSWAFQAGLGRIIDEEKTKSALRALWKYNFRVDVGPYLQTHHGGRPYALPGEGGMLMNTNPKDDPMPYGVKDEDAWQVTYFHECMSGFEHQVASHMMAEGMVDEALTLTRAVHDRYHAKKRNPFNEVECSDHYARAMASFGTFITACGFEYNGPEGFIAFAPKITPENFKAAFTSASGWGSYAQSKKGESQKHVLTVKSGMLTLNKFGLVQLIKNIKSVQATVGAAKIPVEFSVAENQIRINFISALTLGRGEAVTIQIS